jgi:predicted enzyme related to lactoylglutathione lyase
VEQNEAEMRQDGKLDYLEMPGGELGKVKDFYGKAFGWRFIDYGPTYAAFEDAGLDGGFQADADAAPKMPLPVLFATDLEAMQAKVEAAGGEVVVPIFAFPGGRRFHFRDPAGNELAAWSER